jgi:hypothetical protein
MNRNIQWVIVSMLVVTSMVVGAGKGIRIETVQGWPVERPGNWNGGKKKAKRRWQPGSLQKRPGYWGGRSNTWGVPLVRSLLLWALWQMSGQVGPDWLQLLPWLIWLLPVNQKPWGEIQQRLWDVQRILLLGYAGLSVQHLLEPLLNQNGWGIGLLGCALCGAEPSVEVRQTEEGDWQAEISGHFTLQVSADHPFRLRLLLIFLGHLQSENDERKSRRTRDGRTPFVRQEQLANWTHTKQECISVWMKYWLKGDWANLLSLKTAEVLTAELEERIVTVLATFPDWTSEQVREYMQQQGCKVSQAQVDQASQRSGWKQLIATLRERFDLKAGLRLRDEWLVAQLLSQIQALLAKVETLGGLTPEVRIAVADLQTLCAQAGAAANPPLPVQPWLQVMENTVLGSWEPAAAAAIHCIYCGSSDVAPKSKKPRQKKFYDAQGKVQEVAVVRYYCHNPQCSKQTFTHFPAGLLPYSPYRTQAHLLVMQMYAWGYSTYRRSGTALGVYSMTAYRWVSAWGHDLLPVAALFGVVRSSGVVGIDEKYVLVPKNDKPAGKMRRWMYVYLAVDAWTYDLLHIAIYPHNTEDSARAFLLALRAKGYHPTVIVTDLRQDYGPVIAQVFPAALHHECIFHALQNVQKHIKEAYGPNYSETYPEALLLKQQIYAIFDTSSSTEAQARYQKVLALKLDYCKATPAYLLTATKNEGSRVNLRNHDRESGDECDPRRKSTCADHTAAQYDRGVFGRKPRVENRESAFAG